LPSRAPPETPDSKKFNNGSATGFAGREGIVFLRVALECAAVALFWGMKVALTTSRPGVADVIVIGGGVVGTATAMALLSRPGIKVTLLESESELAAHQTGHNSGVIHSGIYYKPGSLKARNCVAGRQALYGFLQEHGIAHEQCGKLIVATTEEEVGRLDGLVERGRANGIEGIRRVCPEEMTDIEPAVRGLGGVFVPVTGIVDYTEVTKAYAREIRRAGGEIQVNTRVTGATTNKDGLVVLQTPRGDRIAKLAINCAGLQCDRVAKLFAVDADVRIIPFKGEYWDLLPGRFNLCRNLIYPVPNPDFPFLGVHFTRSISGKVHAGPNAIPAMMRDGYGPHSFDMQDFVDMAFYPGFIKMGMRHMKMGAGEMWRSWFKSAFVTELQRLVPEIRRRDLVPGVPGIRAQAMDRNGKLLDDFSIVEAPGSIHVLNAPSPAATASISIGRTIANRAFDRLGLEVRQDWNI
jgi:L-2-hydroxyglutarate oxidase